VGKVPASLRLRIACDSKYWLWINGGVVVREGGLKRTPGPTGTYADEVDIGAFVKAGENTVAVLLWYFGRHGFNHNDSGAPGLLVEPLGAVVPGVATDGSWKARRHPAYLPLDESITSYRFPESRFVFDSRQDLAGWTSPSYDDRLWPCAVPAGSPPCAPWGELVARPTPMFAFADSLAAYAQVTQEGDLRRCRLPACAHVHPYLRVNAPPGLAIEVCTDTVCLGGDPSANSMLFRYVTREGEQEFECPAWMSGHEVHYRIPSGVEVLDLKYRESGYLPAPSGAFQCADQPLTTLWRKAARTLLVNMRDSYLDCPDRERSQYAGDSVNELAQAAYVAGQQGNLLTRKCIREFLAWQRDDGVLYGPQGGCWREELPHQSLALAGYYGVWTHYLHSADRETLALAYPRVARYLSLWKRESGRLVKRRTGEWYWCDWGSDIDAGLLDQLWYALALKGQMLVAHELGKRADARALAADLDGLRRAIRAGFLRSGEFRSPDYTGNTDDRANALAVLAGAVEPGDRDSLVKVLTTQRHASPYMERFVLEALFELGATAEALQRMRERYGPMVDSPCSTLFEQWTWNGPANSTSTCNHGWSGCAAHLLPRWLAGLRPLAPGWRRFGVEVQAEFAPLTARVALARGDVEVRCSRSSWQTTVWMSVPPGTVAEWTMRDWPPKSRLKVNGWIVYDKGRLRPLPPGVRTVHAGARMPLRLSPGHYTMESF